MPGGCPAVARGTMNPGHDVTVPCTQRPGADLLLSPGGPTPVDLRFLVCKMRRFSYIRDFDFLRKPCKPF